MFQFDDAGSTRREASRRNTFIKAATALIVRDLRSGWEGTVGQLTASDS